MLEEELQTQACFVNGFVKKKVMRSHILAGYLHVQFIASCRQINFGVKNVNRSQEASASDIGVRQMISSCRIIKTGYKPTFAEYISSCADRAYVYKASYESYGSRSPSIKRTLYSRLQTVSWSSKSYENSRVSRYLQTSRPLEPLGAARLLVPHFFLGWPSGLRRGAGCDPDRLASNSDVWLIRSIGLKTVVKFEPSEWPD